MIKNVILSVVNPLGIRERGHLPMEPLPGICPGTTVSLNLSTDPSPKQLVAMLLNYSGYAPGLTRRVSLVQQELFTLSTQVHLQFLMVFVLLDL
jgi:hypothetical protein